jgi:hypothetical protein
MRQKIDPGARPCGELFASAVNSGMRIKMDGKVMGLTDLKQVRSVCIK